MADRILEGSNSVLVRTLTDAAAPLLAKSGQLDEFIKVFRTNMMAQPEVLKNPKYARHMSEVIDKLTFRAAVAPALTDPDYTIIAVPTPQKTNGTSQHDFDDLLDLIDPPRSSVEDVSLEDEPGTLDDAVDGNRRARANDPFVDKLKAFAEEYGGNRQHPFVRTFTYQKMQDDFERFVVVGTCVGKSRKNPQAEFNANCTTQNFRKIKDVSEDILVHRDGRPVSYCHEGEDGSRYFVWLLRHTMGLEIRFWINLNEPGKPRSDVQSGNVRIRLDHSTQGWARA